MGLGSFLKKVHDPFGHKKKVKKEIGRASKKMGLDDMLDFEKHNLKYMWDAIREDPERLFIGAIDPFSSKMWGEIANKDYDPMLNQFGGPSQGAYQSALDAGIDIGPSAGSHQVAQAIASWYAGGALSNLAGQGAGALTTAGSKYAPIAEAGAAYLTPTVARAAVPMVAGAVEGAASPEYGPAPWDSGPGYELGMPGYGRGKYQFMADPYNYGRSGSNEGEFMFTNPNRSSGSSTTTGSGSGPNNRGRGGGRRSRGGRVMAYKEGGRVQLEGPGAAKKGREMVEEIASIAEVPGALEMLVTMAAEEMGGPKGGKTKQLRLFNMGDGGPVQGYAQGGLSQIMQQAQNVQGAGRGDDEMLLHLAPEEYDAITSMWGEPEINPNTGIPEYGFLSKLWKGIKKTVKKIVKSPLFSFIAPIALNIFAPGLGSAIGGMLGATGQTAATIGNTLLRTGIGAASGGKEGAISGALSGLTAAGVGGKLGEAIGMEGGMGKVAGDAILGGIAGEGTGVGFAQGATGQAMASLAGNPMQKMEQKLTEMGQDIFDPAASGIGGGTGTGNIETGMMSPVAQEDPFGYGAPPGGPMSPVPAGDPGLTVFGDPKPPGMISRAGDWMKEHPWLTAGGALAVGSMLSDGGEDEGPNFDTSTYGNFYDDLPNLSFNRNVMPIDDYYSYGRPSGGQVGEASFFDENSINANAPPPGVGPGPGGAGPGGGGRGPGGGRRGRGGGGGGGSMPNPMTGVGPATGDYGGAGVGGFGVPNEVPLGSNMVPYGPRKIDGIGGMVGWAFGQSQGWTKVGNMMYPPGWDQSQSPYPSAHGGMVDADAYAYKLGGLVRKYQSGGHVRGPGTGRSDEIPAVLSDGEFVIDSETVALLGDGSTDAGARRLEEMRKNLRKHKGKKLAKGGFSHSARTPEKYMAEGGTVDAKIGKSALRDLKRFANKLELAISTGNKKRVAEITAQLKSLDGGSDIVKGLAKGGSVKRIIDSLERTAENPETSGPAGKLERRVKERRAKERKDSDGRRGKKLTDKERADLAEELGGFPKNSRFIRNLRKQLKEKAKETS